MRSLRRSDASFAWLLVAPAAIYVAVIVFWPLFETFRLSFTDATLGGESYIGFDNYKALLGTKDFYQIAWNTFAWTFLSVGLKMLLGLIGATLLNNSLPGNALLRVLIMPPWVIPIAIGCVGWLWLYNGYFGMLAGYARELGILSGPFEFLAYPRSAFISTIITDAWVGTPFVTIYFLAAMQGVPKDLYEAAYVDGASRWYRFRRITIPQIMPVIVTVSLLSFIWTFNSFDIIWIETQGGPLNATTTLIIDAYKTAIGNYLFGEGSTRTVMIIILLSAFALVYLRIIRKVNEAYAVS